MQTKFIDGKTYAKMLYSGAAMLAAHAQEINDLNVFPVADGDTGTNMTKTMEGGLSELSSTVTDSIGDASTTFAKGVLLAARGNSGVILSQIFAGISEQLAGLKNADAASLAEAYREGIRRSYAAVQNPTEGTILTVFRESADYAAKKITESSGAEDFFRIHLEQARRSLEHTKELLPVLKEADVIDSGAAGYLFIAEGMYNALMGNEVKSAEGFAPKEQRIEIERFTRDSVLEHGYCTEFLLRLTTAKCDPDSFEPATLISELEQMGGESIVAYKQEDIIKVHVHTFTPGEVLTRAQKFGEFLTLKIENMSLGHSGAAEKEKKTPQKKFAVIAVATGDGLCSLFEHMGADRIIAGGQTCNPSVEEFVEAFDECSAEHIIVLPNNKNVILAARRAAEIYEKATVHIVETKSLMQGYSALSVITPGIKDMDALVQSATRAAESVIGCEVTCAVRNVTMNDREIKKGDYIAITDGKLTAVAATPEQALTEALSGEDTDLCEIITLFVGKSVSEESRAQLTEQLETEYPDCEITVYEGGQDVYDYMIAIE